jgi:hypothetical protein
MPPPMDYPIMRFVPTEVRTEHIYRCVKCPQVWSQIYAGWSFLHPGLVPNGWRQIDPDKWICPDHTLEIRIDGLQWDLSMPEDKKGL